MNLHNKLNIGGVIKQRVVWAEASYEWVGTKYNVKTLTLTLENGVELEVPVAADREITVRPKPRWLKRDRKPQPQV